MKTRMPPVFKIVERFILKHMKIVFYIKQVLKMAMQQIYLPMLYKRYAGKPVEKGLVIFADAHHEELPFSMRKMYETLQGDQEYKNETWVTDFGKMGYGSLLKWLKQFMKRYAAAEYVFICDNFLPVSACTKRPETKVVQLWHSGGLLKKSGYDLRELVDKDIRKNSKDYDIDEPDKNIDFRRVKNLRIYFEHTATSLTMDVNDIEQWQGGDIVVFKNHIGVISDRRNVEGVPYVIHHNDPYQKNYEEDILQERTDIVGHFRIS